MIDERSTWCEWLVRTYYGDARSCGRDSNGSQIGGVYVCWQHEDILIRAALEALTDDHVGRSHEHHIRNAFRAYLERERERAEGRPLIASGLGGMLADLMTYASEHGIDLKIGDALKAETEIAKAIQKGRAAS